MGQNDGEISADTKWLDIAVELQFIAQAGLTYSKDHFDLERFERIREIAAEMVSQKSGLSMEKVKDLFCNETGFQTPKLDTRAAVFKDGKILLVKEKNGTWSLPGGWVDVNQSVKTNTIKEVKEEAGLDVVAVKLIAVQDRNQHNLPLYAYGICKIFMLCEAVGGAFRENIETVESGYFGLDELPLLAEEKNNREQVEMCFRALADDAWKVPVD
ncbi:NUDIX hydrolase N-terminal domain-containing protein [uncultured Robinsoniella sp.]|uniref:NUDIX hydrolase N-terminal domain-containing protein n=1 Tax=uncultured Robinsoniella sp. TaxID=904190 RepID=UPI00374EE666